LNCKWPPNWWPFSQKPIVQLPSDKSQVTTPVEKLVGSRFTRLQGIDALRGVAALGVVLYHAVGPNARFGPRVLNWLMIPIAPAIKFGYVGVFLFFVISGFCIHLSRARAQVEGKEPISFTAFWKRRFRRLYPPYLIALALYLGISALSIKVQLTGFYIWDVASHVFMLHNLNVHTVYSINGVFWTLAIEEQLYLAYFLLLFLRRRWGWQITLVACLAARTVWFVVVQGLREKHQVNIPINEAAAVHWFTWALGAISVEAMVGIVKLPRLLSRGRLALALLAASVGLTYLLPVVEGFNQTLHDFLWLFLHPLWGMGFFVLLNRFVLAERRWRQMTSFPSLIRAMAAIGLFSYSLYLTHELVIMQSYRFNFLGFSELAQAFMLTTPACVIFAWLFFRVAEKPYLNSHPRRRRVPADGREAIAVLDPQA
jgi:peptidoglycan/LPS O-acetylase OafA/YrhL